MAPENIYVNLFMGHYTSLAEFDENDPHESPKTQFKVAHPLPDKVHVKVAEAEFHEYLDGLLALLEQAGKQIAPTFALIDPFGFSGVPMVLNLGRNGHRQLNA